MCEGPEVAHTQCFQKYEALKGQVKGHVKGPKDNAVGIDGGSGLGVGGGQGRREQWGKKLGQL